MELIIVFFAVPPLRILSSPPALTVVLSAMPPEEMVILPAELTVVVVAVPPSRTVMESFSKIMPSLDSPLEMMYAIFPPHSLGCINFTSTIYHAPAVFSSLLKRKMP
jgi:hypothetical protein